MRVAILFNHDFDLDDDPGRKAREDVLHVAQALSDALADTTLRPELIPVGLEPFEALSLLWRNPPDVAINLCESLCGDARGESVVPTFLDMAGVPYTGSSTLALTLALHKPKAKEMLRARMVPTPDWFVVPTPSELDAPDAMGRTISSLPFPLIVKPSREDASAGIHAHSVVHDRASLERVVAEVYGTFHQPVLVERYVAGREIYVPLLGNPSRALPLAEIDFTQLPTHLPPIVTYAGKWELNSVECVCTPSIESALSGALAAKVVEVARAAFAALECRDYGRVDIRLAEDGTPYVIDVNPNCDLSPEAGFARSALRAGLDYRQLASELVQIARRRHGPAFAPLLRSTATRPDARPDREFHAGGSGVRTGTR
jgi:D-alanine-D-alanine ligase